MNILQEISLFLLILVVIGIIVIIQLANIMARLKDK